MDIYLVRHGSTPLNEQGVYFGWLDPGLSDNGKLQADRLVPTMDSLPLDRVYLSPLRRCTETAAPSLAGRDIPVVHDDRLKEMHFGKWEGLRYQEIEAMDPEGWTAFTTDWKSFCIPDGEGFSGFYERVAHFAKEIKGGRETERILIVAHQGVLRVLTACLLDLSEDDVFHFNFEHATLSHIRLHEGYGVLKALNVV